jgi:DNA replication protein DnaC
MKLLNRLAAYDCLVIAEIGYRTVAKEEAGLFVDIMKNRHLKKCTIITSKLGSALFIYQIYLNDGGV